MTIPVTVPDLGFEDEPVAVNVWLVDDGADVSHGDRVVELLCSGVLVPVTAPDSGRLVAINKRPRARVRPGDVLGEIAAPSTGTE